MRRTGTAALIVALFSGACVGGSSVERRNSTGRSADPNIEITIRAFDFQPPEITVEAGGKVVWENQDDILHTVTSGKAQEQGVPGVTENTDAEPDGLFDHDLDGVGATFEFAFEKSGTFDYFCSIHPGMTGTVTVE